MPVYTVCLPSRPCRGCVQGIRLLRQYSGNLNSVYTCLHYLSGGLDSFTMCSDYLFGYLDYLPGRLEDLSSHLNSPSGCPDCPFDCLDLMCKFQLSTCLHNSLYRRSTQGCQRLTIWLSRWYIKVTENIWIFTQFV